VVGGAELLAHRIASNLNGFQVRVVALGHPEAARFDRDMTVEVCRTRLNSRDRHSLKALNGRVMYEAARLRTDVLLSFHVALMPAALALRALGVPFVQYAYAKEFGVYPRATRHAMRTADAIVAISRYTASLARSTGAPGTRIHRVLPGVDSDVIRERSGAHSASPTLITVSRLDEAYKGHDVILRALPLIRQAVPDTSWIVIGDGRLRGSIEAAAASFPEGTVRVLGRVSDEARDEWLGHAHVFVLPSRVPEDLSGGEGFGIAALEASAHGLPVVAGDRGGTADAVIDGQTGLLVDASSPEAVAEAAVRLLGDPVEAERMGEAGLARARELSWRRAGDEVAAILQDVLDARGREPTPSHPVVDRSAHG